MLQRLFIQNYALIDELEIRFSEKLNIITGETGAGKSIIVGALGLILGERADTGVLVNKEKKCIVEGIFDAAGKSEVKDFLKENDFDLQEEVLIRREIAVNGKSRAFINDTPVTLSQLNELSTLMVDLHQQFDTLALGKKDFQREVIDALAENGGQLDEYREVFLKWQLVKKELEELKDQKQQFEKEMDFFQFQFDELEEAGFKENELEELDAELKLLSNAEGIKTALSTIQAELEEGENPIVNRLKVLSNQLQANASYHPGLAELLQRLQGAQVEIKDIADELDSISSHIHYDPERIGLINERISLGYKLAKKHGVRTTNELLQIRSELEQKLQNALNLDETILQKEKLLSGTFDLAGKLAQSISTRRKKQVKPLEEKVNKLLKQVGMPNAKLKIDINDEKELNAFGNNSIEYLFDANIPTGQPEKKGQFLPVSKVASGGELSRLMLCLKSLVAETIDLPTLIFDEIDTGISGEAARQVGMIMKELAARRQVITITHQPQIAGKADAHFFVYKEIINDAVKTSIRLLTTDERITTIAKMLSGEKPTAAALDNAREMVAN